MLTDLAIEADGLVKAFASLTAVDGVSLRVRRGEVFGLLGPNGAGKTSTVRLLTTLLRPDAGRATIDGFDVVAEPTLVRSRIGLTGQYAAVEERLTGRENLTLIGRLYHLPRSEIRARSSELLGHFDLDAAADRVVQTYSGGMRRRLDIAMSLIARPSVLFLDEPTTGLDPRSRLAMWELIEELGRDGTTVLLTTQYLDEADRLAGQIAVIDHGKVIAEGTPDQLKADAGGARASVSVPTADTEAAMAVMAPRCVGPVTADGRGIVSGRLPGEARDVADIVRGLDAARIEVLAIEVRRPTLDDVFMQLTGHHVDADGASPAEETS